jgi:uncharacterized membrane protein YfcA
MQSVESAAVFAAGVVAGVINSVAGGGTLVSFPALVWAGLNPVLASATNALSLLPSSLVSAFGFRRELKDSGRLLLRLVPLSLVGGALGGYVLLATPGKLFAGMVPYLVLLATLIVVMQRPLLRILRVEPVSLPTRGRMLGLAAGHLCVSFYGGYFGAAVGLLLLGMFGLFGIDNIHRHNGLKNVMTASHASLPVVYFIASGMVDWPSAALLSAGAVAGGSVGPLVARRMTERAVQVLVGCMGLLATALLLGR